MKTQSLNHKRGLIARILIALLALVLIVSVGTWVAGASAKAKLMRENPPPGQLVDVGDYDMHIYCTGKGNPTVILVSGLDDFSIAWSLVQPEIAKTTRVCSYDRAGLGWSEASPTPRTSENMVKELHTLLVNANIAPPYVMVGHSFGGALAQLYVHSYPDDVVGLALVDAAPTDLFVRIPAWGKAIDQKIGMFNTLAPLSSFGLLALSPNSIPNRGFPDDALAQYRAVSVATDYWENTIIENEIFARNLAATEYENIAGFGDLPLIVLSRGTWDAMPGLTDEENQQVHRAWSDIQVELLELSSNGKQVIAEKSEHFIQLYQPELVIEAILELVEVNTE